MDHILPKHRKYRIWSVGISAIFALMALMMTVAEPLRTLAATSSSSSVVQLDVGSAITHSCTATINIGPLSGTSTGDTSSTGGYDGADAVTCTINTNNSTGYTFGWTVLAGTGATGARTGTGHMNGYTAGNRIAPLRPAIVSTPEVFNTTTVGVSDARWAGRLSSTSTTNTGAGMTWGVNAGNTTDRFLNVATGSTVNIAKRTDETTGGGDAQLVQFRAIVGSSYIQPTDTYKVTVTFTATTNP